MKFITTALTGMGLSAVATAALAQADWNYGQKSGPDFEPAFENQTRAPKLATEADVATEVFADGLVHPWGIAELPQDAGLLVTERPGRLRHVSEDGTLSDPIGGVPDVLARGQGGLLDVALGPDFAQDRRVYLTYAKPLGGGMSATAAGYGTLSEDLASLEDFQDIFVQDPPSPTTKHYGSRILFDGEGHAFITTGEHSSMEERVYAQDLDKTYGKVIRVTLDGETPSDNPFVGQSGAVDTIWSYGHRNIQGATFRDGTLWTIEHGPRGGDELNRPEAGKNYGWPVVSYGRQYAGPRIGSGEARAPEFEEPVYYWDPVIAPGGMTVYEGDAFPEWQGDILATGLVSGSLSRLEIEDGRVVGEGRIGDLGRLRDVEVLDDGTILVATDFDDGRLVRLAPRAMVN